MNSPAHAPPVLVEVTRGGMVESRHRGHAAVADGNGRIVAAWGDPGTTVFPRSSIKPLQALPLIESGAAARFGLDDAELALACASHAGEPRHVERVGRWLARLGLSAGDLECGTHAPTDPESSAQLIRADEPPSALHNNCSGKHAGFLTVARHLGEPTLGYIRPEHPVQRRLERILTEMGGADLTAAPRGFDGCGIPVMGMPLGALATAMARFAKPEGLSAERAEAARRIAAAMARHPYLVSGRGRFDSEIMEAANGAALVKGGAEGVHVAALPGLGLGVALKIEDGGAGRASQPAMAALLERLGAVAGWGRAVIAAWRERPVLNAAGREVGAVRAADALRA